MDEKQKNCADFLIQKPRICGICYEYIRLGRHDVLYRGAGICLNQGRKDSGDSGKSYHPIIMDKDEACDFFNDRKR